MQIQYIIDIEEEDIHLLKSRITLFNRISFSSLDEHDESCNLECIPSSSYSIYQLADNVLVEGFIGYIVMSTRGVKEESGFLHR